ncbi:serine hydrolase domain-containing protein [Chelatococcus reniformis]|uniref:Serine hydrolase n=1 Tax=Chelatococcus reniformis TaxID=1494448 RepID=A0A916XPC9_9HYPH|nr:serine hydrolase domain-containing protein [Chelatococcus reniformis]GGC88036.1 serine hydrolase [Chelatococcus reniformis]
MNDDSPAAPVPLGGFVHDRFAEVQRLFAQRICDGTEIGASVAVSIDGEMVADLWGGWADEGRARAWAADTIVNVYSVNKTMMALTALLLADHGAIDFDAPVASYWPEFSQGGKGDIKVSQLMAHSAGLSGWKEPMASTDLYDWDKATTLLARQEPFWRPGTACGYHGITQGYLVGEVVRRVTGQTLSEVFRREIAEPLGADFHLTLDDRDDHRVADLKDAPIVEGLPEPSELMKNIATNPPLLVQATRTRAWRAAQIYAAGGQGNGRSIARVHALLANGGEVNGKRLMSEAGCRRALALQIAGQDLVLSMPARFGMGFGLPGDWLKTPHADCLFWPGAGGALTVIDMKARMSFGYAMNRMERGLLVNPRPHDLLKATWNALES